MKFKHRTSFRTLLYSYIAILLIPLIASVIVYASLFSIIKSFNNKIYLDSLSDFQQSTNSSLDSIRQISNQVLLDSDVDFFIKENIFNKSDSNYRPTVTLKIMNNLKSYIASNYVLDNIYIYSFYNNMFLTPYTSIIADNYGSFFRIGDMDFTELKDTVLEKYNYNMLYPETNPASKPSHENCFYYITTLPTPNNGNLTNGCLVLTINSQSLFNITQKKLSSQNGYFYIYDSERRLISSSAGAPAIENIQTERSKETIDGINYTIFRTIEPNSYNYAIAIPNTSLNSRISQPLIITLISIIISCIVCCVLSLYFTSLNTAPIRTILKTLAPYTQPQHKNSSEYEQIHYTAQHLIDDKIRTQEFLDRQIPLFQSGLLRSILHGTLSDTDSIHLQLKQFNLDNNDPYYIMLLISVAGIPYSSKDSVLTRVYITSRITSGLESEFYCLNTDINETDTIFILGIKDIDNDILHLEKVINNIISELEQEYNFHIKAAFSTTFQSISDIPFHYQKVKNNIEFGVQTSYNNITWCSNCLPISVGYYYPSNVEERIITSFKNGKINSVYSALDTIKERNSTEYFLTSTTRNYLYTNIVCTLSKILYGINATSSFISDAEIKINDLHYLEFDEFFNAVKELLNDFHITTSDHVSIGVATTMLNYIDHHYMDPALCRQSFSDHFHISEVYTSNFFKKHTGYRFSEYVTQVRMNAACELLKNSSLTVNQISQSVGYNSDASFRRAFIAHTGITPKEYRVSNNTDVPNNHDDL